ncbi:MAG: TetR/AcrR family transcriptional regulator [Pseudomonadota bacterium]
MAQRIADIRRAEIVDACMRTLQTTGVALPVYDKIATEADMSRQLVRHYFSDPEELMVAVCDALAAEYKRRLAEGILAAKSTERLDLFLDFYFGLVTTTGHSKPVDDTIYDAMMALAATHPRVKQNLTDGYGLLRLTVAHEIQISHSDLPQRACEELAHLFVALMYGHWKMAVSLDVSPDMNFAAREAMDRLITSYVERYDPED